MYDAVGIEMRRLLGYRGVIPSGWAGQEERGHRSSNAPSLQDGRDRAAITMPMIPKTSNLYNPRGHPFGRNETLQPSPCT